MRFQANVAEFTPLKYREVDNGPDAEQWQKAIKEEIVSHEKKQTWKLVSRNSDMRPIDSKWAFKILRDEEENVVRFKARLCARGFSQVEGLDYSETFSLVIRYDSLRVFLSLDTHLDLESIIY